MRTEELTDSIHRTLLERTLGQTDTAILRDVLAADLPRSVRAYLLAEVAQWLKEDLMTIPRFAQIRLDEAGLYHVQKTMLQTLATSYSLTRDELAWALRVAIQFAGDYLTRPQWTLEHFVFGEENQCSVRTVLARLDYLAEYAYFPRLLEGILRRRDPREISLEEFRHLLEQIDDQIVKQHNPRELALLTKPIFDFLLLKDTALDDPIPVRPILHFFADKKMKIMEEYIGSICQLRGTDTITLTGLIGLIEELYFGKSPDRDAGTAAGEGTETAAVEPALEPGVADTPPVAEPAVDRTADLLPSPLETEEAPRIEETAWTAGLLHSEEPAGGWTEPEKPVAASADLPLPLASLPDLASFITDRQRRRFLKKLFNKDEAFYAGIVNTLNTMPTWNDAYAYLQQVYEIQDLDPGSRIVEEFTGTVQKRYLHPDENEP